MPSSTTDSIYTRSNYSPDRSSRLTSISTAATSPSATPQASLTALNNKKSVKIKPRKPRPKSQPGDWNQLLRLPSDPSIAPSRGSSLRATQSYTDLRTKVNRQNAVPPLPGAMGGNRTSLSMNGPLDAHRRMSSYDEQYRYKDNVYGSARERIHRESPVIAELRTNVIIKDEFTLVTDMSYHLAARYSRPDSSIMINVDHSSCLALAGTFEPCYILSISALPSQMQATTNKRNAALIQSFMADILSVPPERGVIKFIPVPEENFAYNGNTISGEIERLEQQHMGNSGAKRAIADVRKSMPAFSSKRSTSKIDADFAKKADKADGFDGRIEEMQNGIVPAPLQTQTQIPDVFDLVSRRDDEERPSTAHATSSNGTFAALNGLRLNGFSKEDLEGPNSKTPNGRPKTFSGGPVWSSTEDFYPTPRRGSDEGAPAPTIKSEPKQQLKERKSPLPEFKNSSRSSTPVQKQTPRISSPIQTVKTAATITATEKTKPAYLENPPKSALAKNHARSKSKTQSPPEALPQDDSQAANTAKRRSTIQNDSQARKVPAPPPVPESKQAKVSKRKSFLAAFRR